MNKKIISIFIFYFLFSISVNLVHPITTIYVTNLQLPDAYFGFFFSLMSLGQVIGAPLFGLLSDRHGRKWPICIGILGYGLAQAGFGFMNHYPFVILLFRVLAGIFVSAPHILFIALIIDECSPNNRVKTLSYFAACSILGASFGYEIGGSLYDYAHFSIPQIFLLQIVMCCLLFFLFFLFIKEKPVQIETIPIKEKKTSSKTRLSWFMILFSIGFLLMSIGQILISKYLDTYFIHVGYDASTLGHYVFLTGIVGAIANLFFIPVILKIKKINRQIFLVSLVFLSAVLTFCTYSISKNYLLVMLLTTQMVYMVCKSMITPLEQNEFSALSSQHGTTMGIRQTLLSLANVLGPLLGSAIYVAGNPLIFFVSSFIILLSGVLFTFVFLRTKTK